MAWGNSPPMSMPDGTTNVPPEVIQQMLQQQAMQQQMAQQASSMPTADSPEIARAKMEAEVIATKFKAMRDSGIFDKPKVGMMDRIGSALFAGGDSLLGTNNYTNKMDNQAIMYKQQMDMAQQMMSSQLAPMAVPEGMEMAGISADGKPYYRRDPEIAADRKLKYQAKKDLNAYASDASQALVAIKKIEGYADELGDFKTGLLNQAMSKGKIALDKFSKEEKVTNYIGVVSQELIPMARKLMEEKGPITEWDVARVEKGLGDITTPIKTKKLLLNELRNKVSEAIKVKTGLAGVSEDEFFSDNPSLSSLIKVENKSSGYDDPEKEKRYQAWKARQK